MAKTYTTVDGDMVDQLAQRFYGVTAGATEAIYDANRDLAELGPVLSAGVIIVLPDLTSQQQGQQRVQLWA